ncbi:Hypothetical predicted protein [Mytilus galloprovincialis]|uniref:Reverse transcriptase domain-containing protein n=1 Tax=Mytilus galloprovincialis TaxID=29158 RepID=A0A8B6EVY2_MYTGA|nr:Hypothetical predicted protein [Mytilus galloprovincialis]
MVVVINEKSSSKLPQANDQIPKYLSDDSHYQEKHVQKELNKAKSQYKSDQMSSKINQKERAEYNTNSILLAQSMDTDLATHTYVAKSSKLQSDIELATNTDEGKSPKLQSVNNSGEHSSKNFYGLIRRNTNSTKELATPILYGDHKLTDPEEQRETMGKYFQNLATPKDDPGFDENFLNCQFRCEIIKEICSLSDYRSDLFNPTEISKACDEYALSAEHLKSDEEAFDVVHRDILLDKLFDQNIDPDIWDNMYNNLISKVKWINGFSNSFPVRQGVRQGGIISTHVYKMYINDLLTELEENGMGQYIVTNFTGCPTCADDIILLSSTEEEMQSMLDTSKRYSDKHRYKIHPTESVTINKYSNPKTTKSEVHFKLDDKNMPSANQGTHLGIIRAINDQTKTNIQDRIT